MLPPIEDTRTTTELLAALAQARGIAEEAKQAIQQMLDNLFATPEYQAAEAHRRAHNDICSHLTDLIKARALAAFDGSNKRPWPGVNIQEKTFISCTDPEAAKSLALKDYPGYINLDMPRFERLAQQLAGTPHALPMFTIEKKPVATLAWDLSEYLAQPEKKEEVPF